MYQTMHETHTVSIVPVPLRVLLNTHEIQHILLVVVEIISIMQVRYLEKHYGSIQCYLHPLHPRAYAALTWHLVLG